MPFQGLGKRLLKPGVFILIRGASRAHGEIKDGWSFRKLRMIQIAVKTDTVSEDRCLLATFDTKHALVPYSSGSLGEIYTIDY